MNTLSTMNNKQRRNCCVPSWESSSTAQVVSHCDYPILGSTTTDAKCFFTKLPGASHPFYFPSPFPEKLSAKSSTMSFPFRQHPQHPRHVNGFANHPHPPVPVRHEVRVPQVDYTDFELLYRDQFPDRKIPVSAYFADVEIPGHPVQGYTYYQCANDVVACSQTVLSTKIPPRVMNDAVLGVGLQAYEHSVHLGCIVTALHGCCFGFGRGIGRDNGSIDNISQLLGTEADSPDKERRVDQMNWFVQPLIIYLMKYVVPENHPTISLNSICKTSIENVRTHQTRRRNRVAFAQWTENWAAHVNFLGVDRAATQGHYYPFSCLMDRVIIGFFGRISNPNFLVLGPAGRDINPTTDMRDRIHNDRFYIQRV